MLHQVKLNKLSWSPDKDVRSDIDKQYRVPELKQALAWLWNCSEDAAFVKSKKKAEVIDAIIVAIERLLPESARIYIQLTEYPPLLYSVGAVSKDSMMNV